MSDDDEEDDDFGCGICGMVVYLGPTFPCRSKCGQILCYVCHAMSGLRVCLNCKEKAEKHGETD